jgi:hypothetical protein
MKTVNIRDVPLGETFKTTVTERLGYRINEYIGGTWVVLKPSLRPGYVFREEKKPVHNDFTVEWPVSLPQ